MKQNGYYIYIYMNSRNSKTSETHNVNLQAINILLYQIS